MNPQLHVLQKNNLLVPFENLVLRYVSNNLQSSHEIKVQVQSSPFYNQLANLLNNYPNAKGFKEPASFIGSVCSHLAKQGRLRHSIKYCSLKRSKDDAFSN